jgi:hypothetical protein
MPPTWLQHADLLVAMPGYGCAAIGGLVMNPPDMLFKPGLMLPRTWLQAHPALQVYDARLQSGVPEYGDVPLGARPDRASAVDRHLLLQLAPRAEGAKHCQGHAANTPGAASREQDSHDQHTGHDQICRGESDGAEVCGAAAREHQA